jgi:oxygen-dependent protoporphyrinogen oxidase
MSRLLVVGAGIAGLSAARTATIEASRRGHALEVLVADASDRPGGTIRTECVDGIPLEWGPDGVVGARREFVDLCAELGLRTADSGPAASTTSLLRGRRLLRLPSGLAMGVPTALRGLAAAVRAGIVSPPAAARAALEPLLPRRVRGETVEELATRRLGRGVADGLVAPLVHGIFGVAPSEVVAEAVPMLGEPGSLVWRSIRGSRSESPVASARGPAPSVPRFRTVVGGMAALPAALARAPGIQLRLSTPVRAIRPAPDGWVANLAGDEVAVDAVIFAAPPRATASLLRGLAPGAPWLGELPERRLAIVHIAGVLNPPVSGGYLADPREGHVISAATFLRHKWPHLHADGRVRAAITRTDLLSLDDERLGLLAGRELTAVLGTTTSALEEIRLQRWEGLPPGPTLAARRAFRAAGEGLPRGLALAGSTVGAVGVPDCIASGAAAARDSVEALSDRRAGRY